MPIIGKGTMNRGAGDTSPSSWRNPNSMIRNTIKPKSGEFALIKFISDRDEGDISRFHREQGVGPSGKTFTEYIYCVKKNVNEEGQVVQGECEKCAGSDPSTRRTSPRYGYWAFCYAVFHVSQNPGLGKYDDAQEWEPYDVGKKRMWRELVMKPQLLDISFTTWEQLDQKAARYGTLTEQVFEFSNITAQGKTSYILEPADMDVPSVDSEIERVSSTLPDLELVVAKQVVEFEFPMVSLPEEGSRDAEAFEAAVDAPKGKSTRRKAGAAK